MILFLDFDGVLHPHTRGEPVFSRLPLLWKVLRAAPQLEVVFTTTWRDEFPMDYLIRCVTENGGEDLRCRFTSATPNLEAEGFYGRRDLEIQRWRDTNFHTVPWLAIDDNVEIFGGAQPNLYVCDSNRGLTDADVQAILILILQSMKAITQID